MAEGGNKSRLDTMSRSKIIIIDGLSDDSDEEVPEPVTFSSSCVSSEFRSKVESSAANKRSREEEDDSIEESSEPQKASEPPVSKKQKAESSKGGQDEEKSSQRQSELESEQTHQDEAITPDPVSAAKELKVADQEQEHAEGSPSNQNGQETSLSKEQAKVSDAMEWKRDQKKVEECDFFPGQQDYDERSFSTRDEDTKEANFLLCDEEQEEDSFWQENGEERSQFSSRDEEQEAESSFGSSGQEPSPSPEADEAASVLAALKAPSRDEDEQKEELGLSKRKPKAKQFFDYGIDSEDDEKRKRKPKATRNSFDNVDTDENEENEREQEKYPRRDNISSQPTFPEQVHLMITETAATQPELIDWVHNGKAFVILDPKNTKFADLLEKYFNHRKYSSLQRQLNMYGWQKHLKGEFEGAFYNEQFHRDRGSRAELAVIRRRAPPKTKPGAAAKKTSPSERSDRLNSNKVSDEDKNLPAKRAPRSNDTASGNEVVSSLVKLEAIPKTVPRLDPLSTSESYELELALQFDPNEPDDGWQNDWSGNVALLSRDVTNPLSRSKPGKTELRQPLWEWALTSSQNLQLARNLLRHVYNANGTPPTARRILAHAYHQSMRDPRYNLETAMKRVAYDPAVLREDGWTTAKSDSPIGVTGGPYHIGLRLMWESWEAVVIGYIHDSDIGDLWKALWMEGNETFDLEAEELHRAREKWERKFKPGQQKLESSTRFAATAKFTVEGVQHGIVMAKTYSPQARKGLFWPARIMHVSELDGTQSQSKSRSSSKQKLQVIFLAPYWNITVTSTPKLAAAGAGNLSQESSTFSSGPLFEVDTLDASEETIQKYPYSGKNGLDLDQLRAAFRFTGLPKNAFSRFLDSHRLALALKTYAQQKLTSASTHSHAASAALTDTHAMAVETAKFPVALLHLPFEYILSHLRAKDSLSLGRNEDHIEPTIQLAHVMHSMEPPACWGKESRVRTGASMMATPPRGQGITSALSGALASPVSNRYLEFEDPGKDRMTTSFPVAKMTDVATDYLINALSKLSSSSSMSSKLLDQLAYLLSRLRQDVAAAKSCSFSQRRKQLLLFLMACLRTKGQGEDTICSEEFPIGINAKTLLMEWRKACENVFKHASIQFSYTKFGNSVTYVISDPRCNEHITSNGCVERPVRLPAALKGARQAGTGENVEFLLSVGDEYMTLAEQKVIGQAHSSAYLKRMRVKCAAIAPGTSGVPLTDDSNGEGGEDTKGSRGSYTAAVAGVAAAIKGVDMILGGQCVNAFCATRPPGHHAGRELHPMKAISNGFCVLNTAACAALYATTPLSEHGPGLKRICVIDFDVHHGNGTQDILCQTHDPRFLYVSMHAGGAHINGYESDSDESDPEYRTSVGGSQRKEDGIFPGRCGDTSPHKGVLNIPLGARVTAQNVGNALVSLVGPAVYSFSPDLIIVSAGFDAHKNDPLGMGGLSAEDFGHITDVICSMAYKSCSGRVLSILEGGYGVPCCRPQKDLFLPPPAVDSNDDKAAATASQQQLKLLDLDRDLPESMDDQVPPGMQKKLDKCHGEGFVDCVREHVQSLAECNDRSKA